jgi:hypothetical protein
MKDVMGTTLRPVSTIADALEWARCLGLGSDFQKFEGAVMATVSYQTVCG